MPTPMLARKVYEFNKAVLTTSIDTAKSVISVVADGVSSATGTARDAGATVVGQTRSAVDRTVDQASESAKDVAETTRTAVRGTVGEARSGAKEVVGQARAQGKQASAQVDRVAARTADRAVDAVDQSPSSGTPYESWTKEELYERAQELDVEGRSTMSKKQLISALRSH